MPSPLWGRVARQRREGALSPLSPYGDKMRGGVFAPPLSPYGDKMRGGVFAPPSVALRRHLPPKGGDKNASTAQVEFIFMPEKQQKIKNS